MAVLVRCLVSSPSLVSSSRVPRRGVALPARVPAAIRSSDATSFLPNRQEKSTISHNEKPVKFEVPFDMDQIFSSCHPVSFLPAILQFTELEKVNSINKKISKFSQIIMECICCPQNMTRMTFPRTFFAANLLILILPFEAVAETCEPSNSLFNMPLLFGIALIGATVGGLLARQRRGELKRLNDQLRQINAALRRQAKIESYAPTLSYAPVGRVVETEVIVDPRKEQLISNLRAGKNFLRNQDPEKAFVEFKAAFELAQSLGDHTEEKKAARGLGASLQRQAKYREAIKYHSKVLEIAKLSGEDSGSTEAYGAIADCYTELGDLERAGKFYDKYIARLESD
ncbi:hypothetical protein Taro_010436 [Colocasia esculenta]|uniref:Protein FLUORESCENT IN BLUE LIGHT, chloroplastic n=1 Tax=Colocasia esculenta TaxID=4460 RepID=A0A843U9H2_COLES|nr:hypothetical protein [Colocasia esculenta]